MKTGKHTIFQIIFLISIWIPAIPGLSQTLTQTVKGKIFDNESQAPLTDANIVVLGTNPVMGTISDINGNFRIPEVPLGRYNIRVSYLGYEQAIIPEVMITTGKEVVLNIGLKQSVNQMSEVTVNAYSRKEKPLNSMATISARSFTVEETRRYAGGLDDPARMASAFAGVTVGNIQDNAIIIRGNSPKGVSWRLEGVEIPNPNHFPNGNVAGGGAVTIFSSQLLSNSDFFTGAFPAEYSNALAGVFDMKLRNGNSETRESTVQIGLLGIDVASEGPFKRGKSATYLFNYRYSTTGLLSGMGIIPSQQVPKYQDLSFKLNFPAQKAGTFSLWGIGGIDFNREPESLDSAKWETDWDRIYYNWTLDMGATGLTHKITLGNRTLLNTTVAASGTRNIMNQKRLDNNLELRPSAYLADKSGRITVSSYLIQKFNAKHTLKVGLNDQILFYNLNMNGTSDENQPDTYRNFVKGKGHSNYAEFYAESKYDISNRLSVNAGVNANYFALNNDWAIDPRFGVKWEFAPGHSFSFGYGKHDQMEELKIYFISKTVGGKTVYPNKNLGLSHAQHFVFGYDWLINDNLHLKIEPYYQHLYNVPGIKDSSYSMINFKQDWTFSDSLVNNSIGKNIGVDFTLERFLYRNFYYLVTASVFNSKYKGGDGVWRNTRYNKGYALNILVGKEFFIGKNKVLGINGRLNYIGGERYSPVLMAKSLE
ncbi:MAG TPA: TonB-dependent receptor, partial [Bacteroidales bacterium]